MSFKRTVVMKVESIFFCSQAVKILIPAVIRSLRGPTRSRRRPQVESGKFSVLLCLVFSRLVNQRHCLHFDCLFVTVLHRENTSRRCNIRKHQKSYVASFIDRTDVYFVGVSWRELLKPAFVFTDEAGTDAMSQTVL